MKATLREITDAISSVEKMNEDSRKKLYERGRMLRDKSLIRVRASRSQGRATSFDESDIAAAVVAIYASLSGSSWGIIGAIRDHLRDIDNTQGRPEFEAHIEDIKANKSVWARIDIISEAEFTEVGLAGWMTARMGHINELSISESDGSLSLGTRQVVYWPVTLRVKPVLDYLYEKQGSA